MSASNSLESPRPLGVARTPAGPEPDPWFESPATLDVFTLGRRAAEARDARFAGAASFARTRFWMPESVAPAGGTAAGSPAPLATAAGSWRGPRDAPEAYVELADLSSHPSSNPSSPAPAEDTLELAARAGAQLLVGAVSASLLHAAAASGLRVLYRFPFQAGELASDRRARLAGVRQLLHDGPGLWGVMPTPVGEAEGIDTLRVVAALRLDLPEVPHVVLDVAALGPRLAQMALGFGGDELWAPIVSERALRLGGNANNPAMTRKEAAILIRGAGLVPRERIGPDRYAEEAA